MRSLPVFIAAGILTVSVNGLANDCFVDPSPKTMKTILDCFHPEGGSYISVEGNWNCDKDPILGCSACDYTMDNGGVSFEGTMTYAGVITKKLHRMTFQLQVKRVQKDGQEQLYRRVFPISDSSVLPMNSSCYLRDWTRWK